MSRKFSVSNIIWEKGKENIESFIVKTKVLELDAIELALNCIWEEPVDLKLSELMWLQNKIKEHELEISALHALTYTRPDLNFFKDKSSRHDACNYLFRYIDIADYLGVKNLVLGSPSLRKKHGKNGRVS